MSKIILPNDGRMLTKKQVAAALKVEDMPPCVGNPNQGCLGGITDFVLKGYDDKFRCARCNNIHIELVMEESGKASPNMEAKFVAAKVEPHLNEVRKQMANKMLKAIENRADNLAEALEERHEQQQKNFQEEGLSNKERRALILRKYGK